MSECVVRDTFFTYLQLLLHVLFFCLKSLFYPAIENMGADFICINKIFSLPMSVCKYCNCFFLISGVHFWNGASYEKELFVGFFILILM